MTDGLILWKKTRSILEWTPEIIFQPEGRRAND